MLDESSSKLVLQKASDSRYKKWICAKCSMIYLCPAYEYGNAICCGTMCFHEDDCFFSIEQYENEKDYHEVVIMEEF